MVGWFLWLFFHWRIPCFFMLPSKNFARSLVMSKTFYQNDGIGSKGIWTAAACMAYEIELWVPIHETFLFIGFCCWCLQSKWFPFFLLFLLKRVRSNTRGRQIHHGEGKHVFVSTFFYSPWFPKLLYHSGTSKHPSTGLDHGYNVTVTRGWRAFLDIILWPGFLRAKKRLCKSVYNAHCSLQMSFLSLLPLQKKKPPPL